MTTGPLVMLTNNFARLDWLAFDLGNASNEYSARDIIFTGVTSITNLAADTKHP